MFSSCPPGLSGIDKVVPDWIKIQSFVSVQVSSFLSDVDGLKDQPIRPAEDTVGTAKTFGVSEILRVVWKFKAINSSKCFCLKIVQ